jgi:hypothetical protein
MRIRTYGTALCSVVVCIALLLGAGCETMSGGQKGAAVGAGVGALAGQAIGGNTAGTLIGAGVGLGLGYIIGNEKDKNDAKKRQSVTPDETVPFANTAWQIISINPKPQKAFNSKVTRFNPDGTAVTTTVYPDGKVETSMERFRVIGETLIINADNYVINATYRIEGNRLYLVDGKFSAVLQRI